MAKGKFLVIKYRGDITELVNEISELFSQTSDTSYVLNIDKTEEKTFKIEVRWVYRGLLDNYPHDGYFLVTQLGLSEYKVYMQWEDEHIKEKMEKVMNKFIKK